MRIFVDWSVVFERSLFEFRKFMIDVSLGYYQGLCCIWFRFEVVVGGIIVVMFVEKLVNVIC